MSVFMFQVGTWTPGAGVADTTNLTDGLHMSVKGGTTTQMNFVEEVYMGGQAAASAIAIMLLARNSIVGATETTLVTPNSNGPTHPSAGVLTAPAKAFVAATTKPQRDTSVTLGKKNFTFNTFGGIVRANYANTNDRFGILGNTASLGEFSLSAFTGSGATNPIGAHILYETL